MDREKRRSAEDELELDRKIALIRERNLKLEQRLKEVEEDRERDQQQSNHSKSPLKTNAQSTKPVAEKKSGREWDKGKTPASTWRENVPSIDLKGKLAGQKKPNTINNQNNNNTSNNNNNNNVKHPKIPSRLEGRVTFVKEGGAQKKKQQTLTAGGEQKTGGNQKRNGGGQKRQPKVEGASVNQDGKKKIAAEVAVTNKDNAAEIIKKSAKKPRARRESDNYAVKQVVRGMIDKICWLERLEKRKLKKEAEEELLKTSETVPELTKTSEEEKKEEDDNQNLITPAEISA